jgi:hypothetical protein
MNWQTPVSHRIVWPTLGLLFAVGAIIGTRAAVQERRAIQACEDQGQFYWRGQCVPNACRVYAHP